MAEATPKIGRQYRTHSIDSIRVQKLLGNDRSNAMQDTSGTVELKRLDSTVPIQVEVEITEPANESTFIRALKPSLRGRPGYAPSIGSIHGSENSLSSTVERAAQLARSSTRSSSRGGLLPRVRQ